jgi:hypothetical protein
MKKSEIKALIKEVLTEAATVPPNVMDFAKRKGPYAVALVKKAATWAKKAGRDISGGTAIGKNYSTIVLDMKYQGSEIYINLDKETIELFDKEVTDAKSFAKVLANNKIEENTTFGDKLAAHDKKIKQYQDFYFELKSNLMNKYGYDEEDMEDETAERKFYIQYKIEKEADDLFYKKFKIKYQDVLNPFQIKENQSYKGTITDDSAEYILKDLGFKLQHQYDSITGTRFFGPLDQLQKARRELKLKYDIESTISGYGKFAYKELHIPNQTVD